MDPKSLTERYFSSLETGEFVEAAACFSDTARYSHPPYAEEPTGASRHEAYGRAAILALFRRRGTRATRHKITAMAQVGDRCFISGTVADGSADEKVVASFVSEAVLDPDTGLFAEYVAYSSRPAVWQTDRIMDI